jgi:Uma2 family endonuclease
MTVRQRGQRVNIAMSTSKQLVSVDEYDRMIALGHLTENDRVELIRGEIVEKMPIGDSHIGCVRFLVKRFASLLGDSVTLGIQDSIRLPESEPEPDVSILEPRDDCYRSGKARPIDVFLLVEVADSSLDFDRDVKGPLYAEAGIREYWIVNLVDDCVEIYRNPRGGVYQSVQTARRGAAISPLAFPHATLTTDEILG